MDLLKRSHAPITPEAWKQIEPDVVGGLEHSAALLVEQLN